MDEFNSAHQNQLPTKPYSLSHSHMNPNMELFTNFGLMDGFNDILADHHHQPHLPFNGEIPISVPHPDPTFDPTAQMIFQSTGHGWNNMNLVQEHQIHVTSSPRGSGTRFVGPSKLNRKQQNYGGKKRKKMSEREMEKPREVVHVRAKRGQATDSHSLAERLRREKINDKLRSLQDLVPGCYKTMGMAVMLDVIINYVRSLQNQIDFLSMKLSAASLFYDFNSSEAEAMESAQGTNGYEAAQAQDYGGISHQFQTTDYWPI